MKKWHAWAFVALLLAIAIMDGWVKERQIGAFAEANTEANRG